MLLDQKRLLAGNCRTPCDVKLANENARLAKNPVFLKKKKKKTIENVSFLFTVVVSR